MVDGEDVEYNLSDPESAQAYIDSYADNAFINDPEKDLKYKDVHYIYIMKVAEVGDP